MLLRWGTSQSKCDVSPDPPLELSGQSSPHWPSLAGPGVPPLPGSPLDLDPPAWGQALPFGLLHSQMPALAPDQLCWRSLCSAGLASVPSGRHLQCCLLTTAPWSPRFSELSLLLPTSLGEALSISRLLLSSPAHWALLVLFPKPLV